MDNDLKIFKYIYILKDTISICLFSYSYRFLKKEENSAKKILPVKVVESVDLKKKTITQPKNNLDTYFILFNVVLPSRNR